MIIRITSGWILVTLLSTACGGSSNAHMEFNMPNGEIIMGSKVTDIENQYSLTFEQYHGFVANYNDTILQKFTIILEDHVSQVGADVLSEKKITNLKKEDVVSIRFEILEEMMSFPDLVKYMHTKYSQTEIEDVSPEGEIRKGVVLKDSLGKIVCRIQYFNSAIPGSFVTIYP